MIASTQYSPTATTAAAVNLKEDEVRERECSCLQFVACAPPKPNGVDWYCRPWWCLFSDQNPLLHSRFFDETLGELGLHCFDVHRNALFGTATIVSLLGVAMLVFGSVALSTSKSVVGATYWASISATNSSNNSPFSVKAGLSSMVYSHCSFTAGGQRKCVDQSISYNDRPARPTGTANLHPTCSQWSATSVTTKSRLYKSAW